MIAPDDFEAFRFTSRDESEAIRRETKARDQSARPGARLRGPRQQRAGRRAPSRASPDPVRARRGRRVAARVGDDRCAACVEPVMVAALYVQTNGAYYGLPDVDPWDEARDARTYAGPYPVVAHPPCALWVNFAHLNFKRYGGAHNKPGNDDGCFAAALAAVRTWGGGARASRRVARMGLFRPNEADAWRLVARPLRRPWLGGRGGAERLRAQGAQAYLALLRWKLATSGDRLAPATWLPSDRSIRPNQADALGEGGKCFTRSVPRSAPVDRKERAQ